MKILYGVQATGNGHISRARAMAKHFSQSDIQVDYLFSGRKKEDFFDMDCFGDWRCHKGLTFIHKAGSVSTFNTVLHNNLYQLYEDIRTLDLSRYDLVLTDFEPITAWAAKKQNKTCIGMGHQYAFNYDVPRRGDALIPRLIMQNFAPTSLGLGLHWHHFNQDILPPIADIHTESENFEPKKIIVYLGFEETRDVMNLLAPFSNYEFYYYGPFKKASTEGHINLRPLSRDGFKKDLATAAGVICNAGFELSSEAIQLGKKLLIKPLAGQIEQLSNAKAIEELSLGMTMDRLDLTVVEKWLTNWQPQKVNYPDVALAIVKWLETNRWNESGALSELVNNLWQEVSWNGQAVPEHQANNNKQLAYS